MSRRLRAPIVIIVVAVTALAVMAITGPAGPADAHGSTQRPPSRSYTCRFEQPDNPMCAAAWDSNSQALYDWMEVNIGDAAGRHRELIPDGRLCSAGRDKYAALDRPGQWPVTHLSPDGAGQHEIVYESTAPHSTAYYRLYLTKPSFDARSDILDWDDLELVHDSGSQPRTSSSSFRVALPERTTPAILYIIWQRDDSPEAFYACSDVTISGSSGPVVTPPVTDPPTTAAPTTPSPTTPSPTTQPSTSEPPASEPTTPPGPPTTATSSTTMPDSAPAEPERPFSPVAGIDVSMKTTAVWYSGRCSVVTISNTTAAPLSWEVHLSPGGHITALWNADVVADHRGRHDAHAGHLVFAGRDWNHQLDASRWTTFGLCVSF